MLKKVIAAVIALATVVTIIACIKSVTNYKEMSEQWYNARTTTTITIAPNKTLWSIAEQYKPSWMDTREYIHEVKTLNNMDTSFLDVGQTLEIYTMPSIIIKEVMNSEKSSVHN